MRVCCLCKGNSEIQWYGVEGDYNLLVLDFLGPSLDDLFNLCNRKFSLKIVLMLGEQLVSGVPLCASTRQPTSPLLSPLSVLTDGLCFGLAGHTHRVHSL